MFSSACIASRKPFPGFREVKTLRPHNKYGVEVNAIGDDDEAEDERRGRGREETDEEASKRRKFFEDDEEEKGEEPAGDHEGSERREEHFEQDGGDCRAMKKMVNPRLPSREEVEIHEMTHLPYRNWCPHCVKGRGGDA